MPDFLNIETIAADLSEVPEPARAEIGARLPEQGDDTHTWQTLGESVEALLSTAPGLRLDVVFSAGAPRTGYFRVRSGSLQRHSVTASLSADRFEPTGIDPDHALDISVSGDADALADALEPLIPEVEADESSLILPPYGDDVEKLARGLCLVAGVMKKKREAFLISVGGRDLAIELEKGIGARLRPTWPFVESGDAQTQAEFLAVAKLPALPAFPWGELQPAVKPPKPPRRDPKRPFTTGAARTRVEAIATARWESEQKRAVLPVDKLFEALRAPENGEPAFEEVRQKIYSVLADLDRDDVRALLRDGLFFETDGVARFIGTVLWRQKPLLERIVQEELVSAWNADRRKARRILFAVEETYLPIQPSWVSGAPPDLLAKLAPFMQA